jgi:hypothetical protein
VHREMRPGENGDPAKEFIENAIKANEGAEQV